MPFERISGLLRTFRARLTFWNTVAFFALLVLTLFGIREGLRFVLRDLLDSLLLQDARDVELILDKYYPNDRDAIANELDRKVFGYEERGWFAQVLDQNGKVWITAKNPEAVLPPRSENVGQHY